MRIGTMFMGMSLFQVVYLLRVFPNLPQMKLSMGAEILLLSVGRVGIS